MSVLGCNVFLVSLQVRVKTNGGEPYAGCQVMLVAVVMLVDVVVLVAMVMLVDAH